MFEEHKLSRLLEEKEKERSKDRLPSSFFYVVDTLILICFVIMVFIWPCRVYMFSSCLCGGVVFMWCCTISLFLLLGLSLQSLSKELLLLGQVLFYEAILAHLLPNLQHRTVQKNLMKNCENPCALKLQSQRNHASLQSPK